MEEKVRFWCHFGEPLGRQKRPKVDKKPIRKAAGIWTEKRPAPRTPKGTAIHKSGAAGGEL